MVIENQSERFWSLGACAFANKWDGASSFRGLTAFKCSTLQSRETLVQSSWRDHSIPAQVEGSFQRRYQALRHSSGGLGVDVLETQVSIKRRNFKAEQGLALHLGERNSGS